MDCFYPGEYFSKRKVAILILASDCCWAKNEKKMKINLKFFNIQTKISPKQPALCFIENPMKLQLPFTGRSSLDTKTIVFCLHLNRDIQKLSKAANRKFFFSKTHSSQGATFCLQSSMYDR